MTNSRHSITLTGERSKSKGFWGCANREFVSIVPLSFASSIYKYPIHCHGIQYVLFQFLQNYSYKSGGSSRLHYGTSGRRFTSRRLTTTSTTTPPPPLLSYSQMKWRDLGTRQAVEQTRMRHSAGNSGHHRARIHSVRNSGQGPRTYYPQPHTPGNFPLIQDRREFGNEIINSNSLTDTSIREAINHALKVSREGSCKTPRPRLVRVQDFYPHPGKTYVPHCTILHQCSDDTGCCRHDVLTCSPKTTQRVELYFYVSPNIKPLFLCKILTQTQTQWRIEGLRSTEPDWGS